MTDPTPTPTLKPAAQNPWYLLATLYGEPGWNDKKLQAQNRVAWNRYYASQWTDEEREALKDRVDPAELVPFDEAELAGIRDLFQQRATGVQVEMPNAGQRINFEECQFDKDVFWEGYVFRAAYFSSATFTGDADFSSATFTGYAYFGSATFTRGADFSSATFTGRAIFFSATFTRNADFSSATFTGDADFSSATFTRGADFSSATFTRNAYFRSATFTRNAGFSSATFTGDADFSSATFTRGADFSSATFTRNAYFSSATFCQQVSFTNSDLKAPTDFQNCRFRGEPPRFHGAKLHEDTVWRGVTWPIAPTDPDNAGRFTDAYERLKQEMDRLKKHEDELMFFAKELECRRVAAGRLKGVPIAAYGWLCDYGRSYRKPIAWMVALFGAGVPALWLLQPGLGWGTAVGLSAVNCLAGLGIRKDLMDKVLDTLGPGALIVSGVQTILGLILLFLIGLGLRNRFRMK